MESGVYNTLVCLFLHLCKHLANALTIVMLEKHSYIYVIGFISQCCVETLKSSPDAVLLDCNDLGQFLDF